MGPRFRVSSERLEKPGIEPTTPDLEGEQLHHYATDIYGPKSDERVLMAIKVKIEILSVNKKPIYCEQFLKF